MPAAPPASPAGSEVDPGFLNGYSFGPGCGFYLFNRVFWRLALAGFILGFVSQSLGSVAKSTHSAVLLVLLYILLTIMNWGYLALLLWLGRIARKMRWKGLQYKSFAHFRTEEGMYDRAGFICYALGLVGFIALIVIYLRGGA